VTTAVERPADANGVNRQAGGLREPRTGHHFVTLASDFGETSVPVRIVTVTQTT
jgi:hypothetical protein